MTALVRYEAARSALTAAVSVDEVRNIHDVSKAMAYYARQAKDSDLVDKATELRLRAERRLGEMIIAQKETTGLNQGAAGGGKKASSRGALVEPRDTRPTLASAGIDKKLSARAQKIAALPEVVFGEHLNVAKKQAADALRMTVAEKQQRRTEREAELAAKQYALPDGRFGVIYADPPWRFEVYSRVTGLDRDASNHYPVQALEQIRALDVGSIAAPDCVLFLWATVPTLMQAGEVMAAWGFAYKSCVTWGKDRAGTGYWFRNQTEHLLAGTRGDIPAPAPGEQWSSLIGAPVGEHSRKPAIVYELIEAYFPNLPRIELFCRGKPRPGWRAWGNETRESADD